MLEGREFSATPPGESRKSGIARAGLARQWPQHAAGPLWAGVSVAGDFLGDSVGELPEEAAHGGDLIVGRAPRGLLQMNASL